MPFSPTNKFIARATLVDPHGKPLPDLDVRALVLEAVDKPPLPTLVAGEGKSKADGQLELPLTGEALLKNHSVPAIELWLVIGDEQRWLAASITRVTAAHGLVVFDFGPLVVANAPFAAPLERPLHGLPQPLHAPLRTLELKLAETAAALKSTKLALDKTTAEKAALAQTLAATQQSLAEVTAEKAALAQTLAATQQSLAEVTADKTALALSLAATEQSLAEVTADKASLAKTLALKEAAIVQLQAQLDELDREGPPATITEVVEGIGDQLRTARDTLADSAFALGRVSLDLKVVPTTGGTKLAFPTREQLRSLPHDVVSSLTLDFAAAVPRRPITPPPGLGVPDVRGDTEVVARRRLAALDLGVKVSQQELPADDHLRVGRVIKQVPAPDAPVEAGAVVTIVLGKPARKAQ